ncbi:NOB1 family endonuclease [Methanobacterium alcaliphilum]|uniref:NOB1 family endonuclease n=1 Tax=Methanobacterium alcaliphilum TaxID=392018 RepID=UPI00200AAF7E|nr:ribonuclease VapC [Methanobacterium alcaliphilum]MCK9151248.1 ribonuclease VapC [Methanobacterium alcaliphilum]
MVKNFQVLDASAFIGGYKPTDKNNFTIPEITGEVKDLKSKMILDNAINDGNLIIKDPDAQFIKKIDAVIKTSGDIFRLSEVDKKLLALALQINDKNGEVIVLTDDYSMQNVLKIIEIPFKSVLTSGIKEIYAWKLICRGCKREYSDEYGLDDCEICGSPLYKKRVKK